MRGTGRVVAAAGPGKREFLRGLGIAEVVGYDDGSWGDPVEAAIDCAGGDILGRAVAALAPGGRLVCMAAGGGALDPTALMAGELTATGLTMARFARTRPDIYAAHGRELWELAVDGRLAPSVHAEIPLAEAARAHEVIEARANRGKVVLRP